MKKALVILFLVIFSGLSISVNNHVLDVWINPVDNMKFVWVPPGNIMVEEPVELEDSTIYKAKEIIFPNGFWLGQTEVTVKQFSKFVKKTGYVTDAEKAGDKFTWKNPGIKQSGNHPVIFVSYSDVEAYTKWAGVGTPSRGVSQTIIHVGIQGIIRHYVIHLRGKGVWAKQSWSA